MSTADVNRRCQPDSIKSTTFVGYAVFISRFFIRLTCIGDSNFDTSLLFQEIQKGILYQCQIPKGTQGRNFQ